MDARTKILLSCGLIGCPLFLITVLIEGFVRPGYNSFLYPLSSLSLGEWGWIQILNFIITGILLIGFSFGLRKSFNSNNVKFRGPLLIGFVGSGLIGAGIFVTDPIFGYPPNEPLLLRQFTIHGHLHDAFSMLVFVCLPWACFNFRKKFISKGENRWANYSSFTGYAFIAAFIIASMGFKQLSGFVNFAGLFQRLCIAFGWLWLTLLSLHVLRTNDQSE